MDVETGAVPRAAHCVARKGPCTHKQTNKQTNEKFNLWDTTEHHGMLHFLSALHCNSSVQHSVFMPHIKMQEHGLKVCWSDLHLCWAERRSVCTGFQWRWICPRSALATRCGVPPQPPSSCGNNTKTRRYYDKICSYIPNSAFLWSFGALKK